MLVVKHSVTTSLPIIEVENNMIIFEQGELDSTMYFLLDGSVKIYEDRGEGDEHEIAVVKKNEFFGDDELYTHAPRHVSAKTIAPTKLVMIKTESEFEHFVTENRWLSGKIMETMGQRLAKANEELTTKILALTPAIQVELNPDVRPEDKSARRIIRR